MSEFSPALSEGMREFVDTAATFRSASDDWAARRAAFARQCAHFTPLPARPLVVEDRTIGGVTTRVYQPAHEAPECGWPVLVYFHGGGWTMGDHSTHDWFAHALLARADLAIVAVDYRLAPEFSYPAPLDDGLAVWNAIAASAWPFDSGRAAVSGDSAGGTIAAALCMALRARGQAQPRAQALLYPVLSADTAFASMREHALAPMLSAQGLADSIALYLPDERTRHTEEAMPLASKDFGGLAPALLIVATEDVLRDQAVDYAARVREAGGTAEVLLAEGCVHGALRATYLPEAVACYERIAEFLIAYDAAGRTVQN
ncbi:alpha/beta hydrolase [Paraburkholderia acidisoli]|uniref:Alpha/beta hydrolase fold domain-containing protein n=1 Tax=Paraburkholderia acidisoli TaxID=2571748 RepID=A0A7Z2JIV8_9BURK|nr:alpha/beta hydrolase [Paraburkholderia acidisoli]QGZ65558.1 alpha/beta hydrolase fold domain-containing protein [Paraburkholderia acidisoli]